MRHILLSLALGIAAIGASAATLSPEQALARLSGDNTLQPQAVSAAKSSPVLRLTRSQNGSPTLYLFENSRDGGFLLLPANDDTAPLLGYSDSGSLPDDASQLPPAFRYWMDALSRQVAFNAAHSTTSTQYSDPGPDIAPLTTTRWNQDAPYNDDCPTRDGEKCVTGCVATALAQVMKYHNYPPQGTGTKSYDWQGTELSFDYGATTFDWGAMTDTYGRESTEQQRQAVATLMYAAGVSVKMDYDPGDSGAASVLVPGAMTAYFGYDKGVRTYPRDYFTIEEWNNLVYNQLTDFGPVQYSGQSNEGGHSFVCDGYRSGGFFHINWGWGGMSDGYFLLTALNPMEQGIGGSDSGFDFDQDIVANVSPKQTSTSYYEQLYNTDALRMHPLEVELGKDVDVEGMFVNYSINTLERFDFGLILTPTDGGESIYLAGPERGHLPPFYGESSYSVRLPADLPDGTYTVSPAFVGSDDKVQPIRTRMSVNRTYTMVVSNGTASLAADGAATIIGEDLRQLTPFYKRSDFEIAATLNNPTAEEFLGAITPILVPENHTGDITESDVIATADKVLADITPRETVEWKYMGKFTEAEGKDFADGHYQLYIALKYGDKYTPVAGPLKVEVQANPGCKLRIDNFTIANDQTPADFEATATVVCEEGYFFGTLRLGIGEITPGAGDIAITHFIDTDQLQLHAEGDDNTLNLPSSAALTFRRDFGGEPGHEYLALVYDGDRQLSGSKTFTLQDVTALDTIEAPADGPTLYYTLSGVALGTDRPVHGTFIRATPGHRPALILIP